MGEHRAKTVCTTLFESTADLLANHSDLRPRKRRNAGWEYEEAPWYERLQWGADEYGAASRPFEVKLPQSLHQGAGTTPEDIRSRFYEDYHKVAEEYDKDFNKRYDEDLNTTLIFVSLASCLGAYVLTRITGWSVLRRHLRLHPPGPITAPAGPERRNRRSPPCPHPPDE